MKYGECNISQGDLVGKWYKKRSLWVAFLSERCYTNEINIDFQWTLIGWLLIGIRRRGSDLLCRNPLSFPQPVEEGNLSVTSGCWPRPPGPLIIPPRCHNLWSGWREWWGQLTLQQQCRCVCGQPGLKAPPSQERGSVFLTLQLKQLKGQQDG